MPARKSRNHADHPEEIEVDPTERDFVMARLAAARAAAQQAVNAIDESLHFFINPDDDKKGKKRKEMVDEALEAMGVATRSLEMAEITIDEIDPLEEEPWEEGDDEEDGDEDEDEEEDDED